MPTKEMLINYAPGEECRIAIVEDGRLEELYQERASADLHVGNIYKGRVAHIEPAIQAAFIDFGLERNGFLHLSDLHPMYFGGPSKEDSERIGKKTPHRDRPPIQTCLRRGQDILVQVLKEGIGTKGPTLTSYLSIPGRYLVLLPFMERLGVSRKVEDDHSRQEMRKILDELDPPKNIGFIIRTAGIGRTKADIKRDLAYLQRLWKTIEQRINKTAGVSELYTESDLVIRTIRDVFSSDIDRIIVDDESAAKRAQNFLSIANPRSGSTVTYYRDPVPLFHRYDIERQIENIHSRMVPMASGGSLVIDSTEALVAIDVNSGKSRESRDAETTAYKINLEAADEVCRQLRLRDLGGVIVIDLIDMKPIANRREVEQRFKTNLKKDRARTQVSMISQFGILEMTRQRMRPSLKKSVYMDCPACQGAGLVKSPESVLLDAMRRMALVLHHNQVARVDLTISPDAAFHLLNLKRSQLVALEKQYGKQVTVRVGGASVDYIELTAFDAQGATIEINSLHLTRPVATSSVDTSSKAQSHTTTTPSDASKDASASTESDSKPRRRKRRRGGRSNNGRTDTNIATSGTDQTRPTIPSTDAPQGESNTNQESTTTTKTSTSHSQPQNAGEDEAALPHEEDATSPKRRRRRRRGGRGGRGGANATADATTNATADATESTPSDSVTTHDASKDNSDSASPADKPKTRRRRRRRPRSKASETSSTQSDNSSSSTVSAEATSQSSPND